MKTASTTLVMTLLLMFSVSSSLATSEGELSTDEFGKKAQFLRDKGQYAEAAKLYRTIAKKQEGQESDDGESLSAWSEANARTCECLEKRSGQKMDVDADSFLNKIKTAVATREGTGTLAALFSCGVHIGNWESEFAPSEGPVATARRVAPLLSRVTKSARLKDEMLIGIAGRAPSSLIVLEAKKDKSGWSVHAIIRGSVADFDAILAQDLKGAKTVAEP